MVWELLETFAMDDSSGPVIWGRVGGQETNVSCFRLGPE